MDEIAARRPHADSALAHAHTTSALGHRFGRRYCRGPHRRGRDAGIEIASTPAASTQPRLRGARGQCGRSRSADRRAYPQEGSAREEEACGEQATGRVEGCREETSEETGHEEAGGETNDETNDEANDETNDDRQAIGGVLHPRSP